MVVKEYIGRKRYILFSHSVNTSKTIIEKFIRDEIQILGGKIKSKLIKYDLKKDKAPKIISIGKGSIAERILELAEEHHIPIYEDKTMSELLSKLDVDSEIPPHLYTIVAELLAFVYQLDKLKKQRRMGVSAASKTKKGSKK